MTKKKNIFTSSQVLHFLNSIILLLVFLHMLFSEAE